MPETNTRDLIEKSGFKLYEVALLAGMNKGRLSAIAQGYHTPRQDEVDRLEQVLGERPRFWVMHEVEVLPRGVK